MPLELESLGPELLELLTPLSLTLACAKSNYAPTQACVSSQMAGQPLESVRAWIVSPT